MSPAPSASRLNGDDYQHLHTWLCALELLRPSGSVELVSVEVSGVDMVDDLVVKRRDEPAVYQQIKFGTKQDSPIDHAWFLTPLKAGQLSPLKRFYDSWKLLSTPDYPAELALVTNRLTAAKDPLLQFVSGRKDTLDSAFEKSSRSNAGKVLAAWADHLGLTRDQLHGFLAHLSIRTGENSMRRLEDGCRALMDFAGHTWNDAALDCAVMEVRRLIQDGTRDIDLPAVRRILQREVFNKVPPRATLSIEAIDHRPGAEVADVCVDWVDEFIGSTPKERRQLKEPTRWNTHLLPQLRDAAARIEALQLQSVRLIGAMRSATFFAVGDALPRTRGIEIVYDVFGSDWLTTVPPRAYDLAATPYDVGQGKGVAIAVSLTHDIKDDVLEYLRNANVPVSTLINIKPQVGPGHTSVPDAAAGISIAQQVADLARKAKADRSDGVHLFFAGPGVVALFLGHSWNRVPTTHVYEELIPGYTPTFSIGG